MTKISANVELFMLALFFLGTLSLTMQALQCGSQFGGATCANTCAVASMAIVGSHQHTVVPVAKASVVLHLISSSLFEQMLKHRNDSACPGKGFYRYDAFITAANSYSQFGTTGDTDARKREIAAFLAQTSHETTGWPTAPDDPYAWGYCFLKSLARIMEMLVINAFRARSTLVFQASSTIYGRGPIQISYNFNYGAFGQTIGQDLLGNPDLVTMNFSISFKSALWFWMTPQSPKPSCHAVMTAQWTPSASDQSAGRLPGYGVVTDIINGGLECGGLIQLAK